MERWTEAATDDVTQLPSLQRWSAVSGEAREDLDVRLGSVTTHALASGRAGVLVIEAPGRPALITVDERVPYATVVYARDEGHVRWAELPEAPPSVLRQLLVALAEERLTRLPDI